MGFIEFYWVLLGLIRFYWVLLGFTGFAYVLLGYNGFYWVLLGFVGVLQGFTGFYWVIMDLIEFDWVWLGFTEFYWVLQRLLLRWKETKKRRAATKSSAYFPPPTDYESILNIDWSILFVTAMKPEKKITSSPRKDKANSFMISIHDSRVHSARRTKKNDKKEH